MPRMIDADALNIRKYTRWFENVEDVRQVERMIREAPTITPPPNPPLTLDELQGMDDVDLAMLEIKIMPEKGQFRICECSNGEFLIGLKSLPISEYGKTWIALPPQDWR